MSKHFLHGYVAISSCWLAAANVFLHIGHDSRTIVPPVHPFNGLGGGSLISSTALPSLNGKYINLTEGGTFGSIFIVRGSIGDNKGHGAGTGSVASGAEGVGQ